MRKGERKCFSIFFSRLATRITILNLVFLFFLHFDTKIISRMKTIYRTHTHIYLYIYIWIFFPLILTYFFYTNMYLVYIKQKRKNHWYFFTHFNKKYCRIFLQRNLLFVSFFCLNLDFIIYFEHLIIVFISGCHWHWTPMTKWNFLSNYWTFFCCYFHTLFS